MQFTKQMGLGISLGIIGPWLGLVVYYLMLWNHISLLDFWNYLSQNKSIQSPVMSLALIFNGLLFFILLKLKKESIANGIVMASIVYAPIIIYLKLR